MTEQLTHELLCAVMSGARTVTREERALPAAGERVVHRRGVWLHGRFRPSTVARTAIGDGIFSDDTDVCARFSAMNDNENAGARPNVYGLAVRFGPQIEEPADLLMLNLPLLPVSTGSDFLTLTKVLVEQRGPDAVATDLYASVRRDAAAGGAGPPSVQGTLAFMRSAARGRPRTLAEVTYHSIHAFRLARSEGLPGDIVRLSWRPEAGDRTLVTRLGTGQWPDGDDALFAVGDDDSSCFRATVDPLARPIVFSLDLVFAPPGADPFDTSCAFPSWSPYVSAGRLVLEPTAQDTSGVLSTVRFKPHLRPNGLLPIDDDIMRTRAAVYGAAPSFDPSAAMARKAVEAAEMAAEARRRRIRRIFRPWRSSAS